MILSSTVRPYLTNTYSALAVSRLCGPARSRMTAPVGYWHIIPLHRQYMRHRQYECQRGQSTSLTINLFNR